MLLNFPAIFLFPHPPSPSYHTVAHTHTHTTYTIRKFVTLLRYRLHFGKIRHSFVIKYFIMSKQIFRSLCSSTYIFQSHYDEQRKIDKKEKQGSSGALKLQRYTEAAAHVMKPLLENIAPLHASKVWEEIRYVVWEQKLLDPELLMDKLSIYSARLLKAGYAR